MPPISSAPWTFAVCALLALPAIAQNNTSAPSPQSVAAPAPLPYTSALQGYQPFADEKVRSWKESNATVEKIGGWRAYAKEAAEPEAKFSQTPAASSAASPKTPAAPADPHAGHGKH
jgi:hypothetical protein